MIEIVDGKRKGTNEKATIVGKAKKKEKVKSSTKRIMNAIFHHLWENKLG